MKTIQKFNYYSQTFERKGLPYKGWNLWNYIYIYIYNGEIQGLILENRLEHYHQLLYKKYHFDTLKTYFTILAYHFTAYHLSDVLLFNSIH